MALLDGQYTILSEQNLSQGRSLFEATTRSGERVRILWYELSTLEDEQAFEGYRRLLRYLRQEDLAAIHDIVSRPGANYVVWEHPIHERVKFSRYAKEFAGLLSDAGYKLEDAHIHVDSDNQAKVYMLELASSTQTSLVASSTSSSNAIKSVNRKTIRKTRKAEKTGFSFFGLPVPPLISWLPGLFMVAIAAGLLNYSFGRYVNTQEVLIPDLVGLDIDVAGQEVQSLGLNSQVRAVISDDKEGTVVNMQPIARSLLRQGRTVQLMYAVTSLESKQVLVPQLVARGIVGEEAANAALEEAGLNLGKAINVHSSLAQGQVIAQSVVADKAIAEGSSLDVIFSKGPRTLQTFIPEFRGLTLEEAQPYIDLLGLTQPVQVDVQVDSDKPTGTILDQYIKANTIVDPTNTTLRLLVAKQAEPEALRATSTPNFIGILNLDQAYDLAAEYGFEISSVNKLSNPNLNHGVVSQTPLAYEPLAEASDQITLMFNENVQHLSNMQNQNLVVANTLNPNINTNPIGFDPNNPNALNPALVNPTLVNPMTATGVGPLLAPIIPQSSGNLDGAPIPIPRPNILAAGIPTPNTPIPTDVSGMTPVTTTPIPTPANPIGIPSLPELSGVTTNTANSETTFASQVVNQNGNYGYSWTIAPVSERQLVAVHVNLQDGSSINIDARWLEAGTTEVAGSYSYPSYTGQLIFELRDYNSGEAISQPISYP